MLCNGDCVRMPADVWEAIKDAVDWHTVEVRDCSFDAVVVRTASAGDAAHLVRYATLACASQPTTRVYLM